MNWFNALMAVLVAALFEFSVPVIAALLVLYVAWLVVKQLWKRRQLRRGRAVVAAAVGDARADAARAEMLRREYRIRGERATVRLLPRQRDGGL